MRRNEIPKGLPQYFGIFYACGYSLITIGILSTCYHSCPTAQNFQFDTTFMYVVAILLTLKIYQFRHPNAACDANKSFFVIAIALFLEVIGIHLFENHEKYPEFYVCYWIFLTIIYIYFIIKLAPILYKSGKWTCDIQDCNIEFFVSLLMNTFLIYRFIYFIILWIMDILFF